MSVTGYTSLIAFHIHPGRAEDFIAAFKACGMLTRPRSIEGFVSAELIRGRDDPTRFAVIARWRSPEAYAMWQAVAQSGAPPEALAAMAGCILRMEAGALYEAA